MVDIPVQDTPAPSAGPSKRTLLIGAAVLGGAVGLVLLVTRLSSKNNANAVTNQATTSAPTPAALDIAYQNLATQLLGFRGDVSVANAQTNADLGTLQDAIFSATQASQAGTSDVLTAIGNESTARALSNDSLIGSLTAQFAGVNQRFDNQLQAIQGTNQEIENLDQRVVGVSQQVGQVQQRGAGGATLRDSVLAAFDGGMGDASEGLARLSAGPVRVVSRAA